jgi:hypothetical protein
MHKFAVGQVPSTALWEYLSAAKLALQFQKPEDWADQAGHPLGFAAALLLFCVVDAIGSHHRGSSELFPIEGKHLPIKKTNHHFFVLNAPQYFAQNLSRKQLDLVYEQYRSTLAHNASIAPGCEVYCDQADTQVFVSKSGKLAVNLVALHHRSIAAVQNFQASNLAASSLATQEIQLK